MRQQSKISFFYTGMTLVAILLVLTGSNAVAEDIWTKEREKALSLVTPASLMEDVTFLSDSTCQGRATGTEGAAKAAQWIADEFQKAGLEKMTDSWEATFPVSYKVQGSNVIGMLAGSKSIPCERYIIVGAHYDHLGIINGKIYPGADSNASGVAALTSLAQMTGAMRKMGRIFGSNIIFVAFDALELGLKGSEALWNMIEYGRLKDPVTGIQITPDKVDLMVNIDQIGSSLAPISKGKDNYVIMLGTSSLEKSRRSILNTCNKESGTDLEIGLDYYGSANFTKVFYRLSDQRYFVDNKIPSVLFTSGITMNNNKVWDTPETLNPEVFHKRVILMYHWLEKML